jgi:hypothetical protein
MSVLRSVWTVKRPNATVDAGVHALPADMRARLAQISFMVQEFGLERMHEPRMKRLRGPIWEMRLRGRDGIAGALRRREGSTGGHRPCVREEDPTDAKPRS